MVNFEERNAESREVEVLQTLIRIRTALPRGDEMDCVRYLLFLFPPFAADYSDGRIYGRDAINMKGGLVFIVMSAPEGLDWPRRKPSG